MASLKKVWAVVPAGGVGRRMQQALAKQYIRLHGRPIIEHTLSLLLANEHVQHIVTCISEKDEHWAELAIANDARISLAAGGQTRAESVLNGLIELQGRVGDDDWVMVHDAARPCLEQATLNRMIDQLVDHPVGGILAMPSSDTIKKSHISQHDHIEATLERSCIWLAQTPQMFRYRLLHDALSAAIDQKVTITDEASALEWAGHTPKLVEGSARNLKITTPDDLGIAEFLLSNKHSTIPPEND